MGNLEITNEAVTGPGLAAVARQENAAAASDGRSGVAAWYLRKRHRRVWALPLTAGLLVFAVLMLMRGTMEDPHARFKESHAAMLALAPAAVPDGENAALDYTRAFAIIAPIPPCPRKTYFQEWDPHYFFNKESKLFEQPQVAAYLASNAAAIMLLNSGAAKERCDWKLNYSAGAAMPDTHLRELRNAARILTVKARMDAHAGDHTAAAESIRALYAMARHCESDPLLMPGLVSIAITRLADGAIESIARWDTPTRVEQVEVYRKTVWQDRTWPRRAERCLSADKKITLYILDGIAARKTPARQVLATGLELEFLSPNRGGAIWYGAERRCYSTVMDEIIKRVSQGEIIWQSEAEALIEEYQQGPALVARGTIVASASDYFAASAEQAQVTDAGLAFLSFRIKHGRDAKSLDELIPEFLPTVPVSVIWEAPLRMRVDEKGVLQSDARGGRSRQDSGVIRIYGCGINGRDNRGIPEEEYDGTGADDTVFRVPPIRR